VDITDQKLIYNQLKTAFKNDDKNAIEEIIFKNPKLLHGFTHHCTSEIDNPLKEGVVEFISEVENFIVATGDTANASKNINDILYPQNAGKAIIIRNKDLPEWQNKSFSRDNTIIFAGINDDILLLYKRILIMPPADRPPVIFSEMSTEGKRK
jgi:hypothetical protein